MFARSTGSGSSRLTHRQAREELDKVFVGDELGTPLALREHLRGCESCRAYFNQLAEVDAVLAGREDGSEPFGLAFSESVVMSEAAVGRQRPRWTGLALAATILLVAAGAVLVAEIALQGDGGEQGDGFRSRGAQAPSGDGLQRVEAFCIDEGPDGARIVEARNGELTCEPGAQLKFAYTNAALAGPELGYLTLLAVDDDLEALLPLPPASAGTDSMRVEQAGRMKPLGRTLELRAPAPAQPREVVAVFSERPLPRRSLGAAVDKSAADDAVTKLEEAMGSMRQGAYSVRKVGSVRLASDAPSTPERP